MIIPFLIKKGEHFYYANSPDTIADDEDLGIVITDYKVRIKTDWYEVIRNGNEELGKIEKVKADADQFFPQISYDIFLKSLAFFRMVYEKYKAESMLLLALDRTKGYDQEYEIIVPEQEVSGGSIDYKVPTLTGDMFLAGSIHSHPSFSAFQSGTDKHDELHFDGIHITLGKVTDPSPEVHQRFCVNGECYDCEGVNYLIESKSAVEFPETVVAAVKGLVGSIKELDIKLSQKDILNILSDKVKIITPEVEFPKEWMEKVSPERKTVVRGFNPYVNAHGYKWQNWGYGKSFDDNKDWREASFQGYNPIVGVNRKPSEDKKKSLRLLSDGAVSKEAFSVYIDQIYSKSNAFSSKKIRKIINGVNSVLVSSLPDFSKPENFAKIIK